MRVSRGHGASRGASLGAIALRLAIGIGFANYDTLYSLVWGQQLARGADPGLRRPAGADAAPAARAARA